MSYDLYSYTIDWNNDVPNVLWIQLSGSQGETLRQSPDVGYPWLGMIRLASVYTIGAPYSRVYRWSRSKVSKFAYDNYISNRNRTSPRTSQPRPFLSKVVKLASRANAFKIAPLVRRLGIKPDLIFVGEVRAWISDLDKFSCPKVYYASDPQVTVNDYFNLANLEEYDHVFVSQKDYVKLFEERGMRASWLPYACYPSLILGPRKERYDVGFCGSLYGDRLKFIEAIRKEVPNTYVGKELLGGLGRIYRSCRIVFNRCNELVCRDFEATGAGSLLIRDRISNGLFDLFKEDYHIVCYSSERELIEKLKYYLTHEEDRRRIARQGQELVLSEHTVEVRALQILKTVKLIS